jgi:hypothetical protein
MLKVAQNVESRLKNGKTKWKMEKLNGKTKMVKLFQNRTTKPSKC